MLDISQGAAYLIYCLIFVNYIRTLTRNKEIIKYHARTDVVHGLLLGPPEEDIFGLLWIHTEILSEFVINLWPMVQQVWADYQICLVPL